MKLQNLIKEMESASTIESALEILFREIEKTYLLEKAVNFAIKAHEKQIRKSGQPYVTHPILVSAIVAKVSGEEAMVIAGLLHDVVEDTEKTLDDIRNEFGTDVAYLVDGLTKIDHIREKELAPSGSGERLTKSALSFRKMLTASISDLRILVIKLCDRVHNLSTLGALKKEKQIRVSEESLLVYAPIAHRLGISFLKSLIEDFSFQYLFEKDYKKISQHIDTYEDTFQSKLFSFKEKISLMLLQNEFLESEYRISSRIKHKYSIYRKMQRKGVNIDEVLDLLAIRIIVKEPIDVYRVLGIIHQNFKPLPFRFKDYVASPKDNGYQTLHTTVFDKNSIFEVQIRTFEMDRTAEYGFAAHWKYKEPQHGIKTEWLQKLDNTQHMNIGDYCDIIRDDLLTDEIIVYSREFDTFTLPQGSVVLDFAYKLHSEIGNQAKYAYVNKKKVSLLTELHSGDIVRIVTAKQDIPRCSWIDSVKTHYAKKEIKNLCGQRKREIDLQTGFNIIKTILAVSPKELHKNNESVLEEFQKVPQNIHSLRKVLSSFDETIPLKTFQFKSLKILSNKNISGIRFDYCCHPHIGDDVVGVLKEDNKVYVHHKMCSQINEVLDDNLEMVYLEWENDKRYRYDLIVSVSNHRGALADFLQYLVKLDIDLLSISTQRDSAVSDHTLYFELEIETDEKNGDEIKKELQYKVKVIKLSSSSDNYKN
jgi:guanosine-3',5'-bis(diphosphate) 3'-pyrophosphohydrolase